MHVEIADLTALEQHLTQHASLDGLVVQDLDLSGLSLVLGRLSGSGAVFLGCVLDPGVADHLRETGAVLFPRLGDRPYRPYRTALYTAEELLEGMEEDRPASFWESSRDARIYHYYRSHHRPGGPESVLEALAQRLHDHAMEQAKRELLAEERARRPVAIMGGHAMRRDAPAYAEVVRLAARLAQGGYFMVSGGGPGAMEATHLGAWLAPYDDLAVEEALAVLAAAPTYRDEGWLPSALEVRRRWPSEQPSLAIPTWFYGHEPTNLFASHVAKFFSNSLREDGLLALATHGVVFAPGSAGTVQEIFMDAAQNHYGTFELVSPMVFLGTDYWQRERPVEGLLSALSEGRQYAAQIAYVDAIEDAVAFIEQHPPVPYVAG